MITIITSNLKHVQLAISLITLDIYKLQSQTEKELNFSSIMMHGDSACSSELVMWVLKEESLDSYSLINSYIFISSLLIYTLNVWLQTSHQEGWKNQSNLVRARLRDRHCAYAAGEKCSVTYSNANSYGVGRNLDMSKFNFICHFTKSSDLW